MATIRSYTTIEQSKVLSKILPLECADMCYIAHSELVGIREPFCKKADKDDIPCWSLAALLNVLPDGTDIVKEKSDTENEKYMCTVGIKDNIISTFGNNPVDACYEMIIKLNEHKML